MRNDNPESNGMKPNGEPLPANGKAVAQAQLVTALVDPDFLLKKAIPVQVAYDAESACWIAGESLFGWHGMGDTQAEAIDHLVEVILEDYAELSQWTGELSPELAARLHRMQEYIAHADKVS